MKVLKFLKSVGIDLLTFLIILAVFLVTIGLIGFLVTSIPVATANITAMVIVGVFFILAIVIFIVIIIDYLTGKWKEIK